MPFCPRCGSEYENWVEVCPDDGERLVDALPEKQQEQPTPEILFDGEESGLALETDWREYAEMVAEFLNAHGIKASVIHKAGLESPQPTQLSNWFVIVPGKDIENAQQMVREFFTDEVEEIMQKESETSGLSARAMDNRTSNIRPTMAAGSAIKILVGAATFYFIFYVMVGLALAINFRFDLDLMHNLIIKTLPLHLLTIPIAIFLNVYYLRHYLMNDRIQPESRNSWRLAFFFLHFLASPFYFYTFIWNEPDLNPNRNPR